LRKRAGALGCRWLLSGLVLGMAPTSGFFSAPVAAAAARQMGCYLITETMSRRHQLSMDSYDRLFPSQDTLPRGGFGNLIALPLQHEPRQQGNSVFVDEQFKPYPADGQWAYLASVLRIDPGTVEQIAREASRQGLVIGVRSAETVDEQDVALWSRLPSRRSKPIVVAGPLPPKVRAILAQKLFIENAGLPSAGGFPLGKKGLIAQIQAGWLLRDAYVDCSAGKQGSGDE